MQEIQKDFIQNAIKQYDITDAKIAELSEMAGQLSIKDIDDKEGYEECRKARILVKGYRVAVDKKRKELNTDAIAYKKAVDDEAKRITGLLEPIESELFSKEDWYEEEHKRIKDAAEEAKQAKFKGRFQSLQAVGFVYNGSDALVAKYFDAEHIVHAQAITYDTDERFNEKLCEYTSKHTEHMAEQFRLKAAHMAEQFRLKAAEEAKQAEEAAARKAQAAALETQRKEQEAERASLAEIARQQAEKEALLKAEADKLQREKDDAIRLQRLQVEAERRAKEKLAAEAAEAEAKKARAAELAAKKAARAPDKEKLMEYYNAIQEILYPQVKSREAITILDDFTEAHKEALENFWEDIQKL